MDGGLNLVGTAIATAIGAWVGAWAVFKKQENKNSYPKKLMIEMLKSFKNNKKYSDAKNEFNKRLSIEKRAVAVALKNVGVPIIINISNDEFDIENVDFEKKDISEKELEAMIDYVEKGFCDDLFFREIGKGFYNAPPKIIFARNIALKFLNALSPAVSSLTIQDVLDIAHLTFSQYQVIQVFYDTVNMVGANKKISQEEVDLAKKNVKDGIFDHLFYWDYRMYQNMISQKTMADNVNSLVTTQKLVSTP